MLQRTADDYGELWDFSGIHNDLDFGRYFLTHNWSAIAGGSLVIVAVVCMAIGSLAGPCLNGGTGQPRTSTSRAGGVSMALIEICCQRLSYN